MVTDITSDDFTAQSSGALAAEEATLSAAHAQAVAELNRIRDKAATSLRDTNTKYSLHSVDGIGKYVIPRQLGWKPLIEIIHDPLPNIDFSANIYPAFDGIIGDHFQSPYLLDPLNERYESYESLRDNIAAVRNFLMQTYYADSSKGISSDKARQSLAEIAAFVGDGLYNNFLFLYLIPNHNPTKPFIDLKRASEPGGRGAQYLYEKILEHQRHSNWLRPFAMVTALFGGKPTPDWKLPGSDSTHFTDFFSKDIAADAIMETTQAELDAATTHAATLAAQLDAVRDARMLSTAAGDLDAIGNHLLFTAQHMDGVAQLSEPVRRDAVTIAKDILRKLKFSIGDRPVIEGLNMQPSDDMATLGAIKGVTMVYERLLAWARSNNDSEIFRHPSIIAATQAIGQFGYLAKCEALRIASMAGNSVMVEQISEQLKRIPQSYAQSANATFGGLLETIEQGIDTVINRTQEVSVSGAKVGLSVDNRGSSMDAPPTAGTASQLSTNDAAQRNAELLASQQLAALAHTQRMSQQNNRAPQAAAAQGGQAQSAPQRSGNAQGRQQAAQSARTQRSNSPSSLSATSPLPGMNPLQLQALQRNAALRAAHEREEQQHHEEMLRMQQQQQQQMAQKTAAAAINKAQAAARGIDPNMLNGFKNATSLKGVTGNGDILKPGRPIDAANVMKTSNKAQAMAQTQAAAAPKPAAVGTPNDQLVNPYTPPQLVPPRGGGRGY